jgi:CRP-like cAMP-binding protein
MAVREPGIARHLSRASRAARVSLDRLTLLREAPLFSGVEADALARLASHAGTRRLAADQTLFHKGDPGGELCGVLSGRLRVRGVGPEGRSMVFSYLDPGAIFGEIAIVDRQPRSASIDAAEPSEVLVVHRAAFAAFVREHPQVAINLARVLAARLRRITDQTEDAFLLAIPARLARRILGLAETYGRPAGAGIQLSIRLPQHELAELIGATRESVNKLLRRWSERGVVSLDQGVLTVLDPRALREVAELLVE